MSGGWEPQALIYVHDLVGLTRTPRAKWGRWSQEARLIPT